MKKIIITIWALIILAVPTVILAVNVSIPESPGHGAGYVPVSNTAGGYTPMFIGTPSVTVCSTGCTYSDIETAVDTVAASTTIFIKNGTYALGATTVTIAGGKTLEIVGESKDGVIITYSGTGNAFTIGDNTTVTRHTRIENLYLKGSANGTRGFNFVNVRNSTFSNLRATGFTSTGNPGQGFRLDGSGGYTGDNYFFNLQCDTSEICLNLSGTAVNSNHFYGFNLRTTKSSAGARAISLTNSNGNTFSGGLVGNSSTGMYLTGTGDENIIESIYCEDNTLCADLLSGSHDNRITLIDVETNTTMVNDAGARNNVSYSGLDSGGQTYFNGGNFGIGTTSPYAKLSVVGQVVAPFYTATSTTATSSFSSGINIATGTSREALTLGKNKRLSLETDQLWTYSTGHLSDVIRLNALNSFAKPAITWYDASSTPPGQGMPGIPTAAIVVHDYLSDFSNRHQHISIETKDASTNQLQSRFECLWGYDNGDTGGYCGVTSDYNFRVGSGSDIDIVDGRINHYGVLNIFPNTNLGNTTIALRVATTSGGDLSISASGANYVDFGDDIKMTKATPLIYLNSPSTGDYASTIRLAGEAGQAYQGGYLQFDALGNEFIIGTHDTANELTSSDVEVLRMARNGLSAFFPTAKVGIGTTSPMSSLSVVGTTTMSNFQATSTTATSTVDNAFVVKKYLGVNIGGVTPDYGYIPNFISDMGGNTNGFLSLNVYNESAGTCASADITANNDTASILFNYGDFGHTSTGYRATGCGANDTPIPGQNPNSTYIFDPNGSIQQWLGSSNAIYSWGLGGGNGIGTAYASSSIAMVLRANGNFGIGTTTPTSLFTVGTSTSATATTTIFIDSTATKGSCVVLKDADGSGYSYITINNGVISASTKDCRIN